MDRWRQRRRPSSRTKSRLRGTRCCRRFHSADVRPHRGWDRLRLLSAGNSTFKYHLGSEDRNGHQDSTISVFTRDADGPVRHFYSAYPRMSPAIPERGIDLLAPIWHFLDLTPQGRGDWYTSLDYGTKIDTAA